MYLPNYRTDYIQGKIYNEQRPYELEMLEDIRQRLKPDDLVLDIGANVGNHSLYLAAVAGCRVMAFEPNQALTDALSISVEMNGLTERVSVHALAVGEARNIARFEQALPANLGGQRIALGEGGIEVVPLDEMSFAHPVALLKVDVEGAELSVLKGAVGLLTKHRPVIYVECQSEAEFRPLASWLESVGYGYWDTFNATPTHLFLHNEQFDIDRRLSRLQLKEGLNSYRYREQLTLIRQQLDEANRRYRKVTEQEAMLKQRLAAEQSDRQRADDQLDVAHQKIADLQKNAQYLQTRDDERLDTISELTSRLTESDLDRSRQLDEANEIYRTITVQFAAEQLDRQKAEKQLSELRTELHAFRSSAAGQQHKIEELKQNLKAAEQKRLHAEERLIKTRASLTYQLGYQIKSGVTSLEGFVRLPTALFRLYRSATSKKRLSFRKGITKNTAPIITPLSDSPLIEHNRDPELLETGQAARKLMISQVGKAVNPTRVACVMDEFSYNSFRHECNLLQLTPGNWSNELNEFRPQMLLIESAWRGTENLWGNKVGHNSQELQGIVAWCRTHGVPTAFWNKEDPVHFETFLTTAKQFDSIFTTDIDCIHRYKAALGHERVYLLPFACQPVLNNPIEVYRRKDAFCFAGAYYARYPDRTRDLQTFVRELPKFRPLEIYDRNFGKDDANYRFPAEYQPHIVGNLPFNEIDKAYKAYRYALNLNSIKQSQSMFARRVFELLGSNTLTISNFSRGVRLLFGDLVISTDSGAEAVRKLSDLENNDQMICKIRLAGLRKVMLEHTYAQRIDYVFRKVLALPSQQKVPTIQVFGFARDEASFSRLLANVKRQILRPLKACVVVSDSVKIQIDLDEPWLELVTEEQLKDKLIGDMVAEADFVACFSCEDYYGPNYLLDIALATRYSNAGAIGKSTHYTCDAGEIRLHEAGSTYSPVEALPIRASIIEAKRMASHPLKDWLDGLDHGVYREEDTLAIDPYNYCRSSDSISKSSQIVDDIVLDTGLAIDELQARAEAIPPLQIDQLDTPELSSKALESLFGPSRSKSVRVVYEEASVTFVSSLADGKHEYLYATRDLLPADLGDGKRLKLFLEATPGLNLQLVILMLDGQKQRISHVMGHANRNITADVPPETAFIRLGWRIYASGSAQIGGLLLGHRDNKPSVILERSHNLLLTNHYPAYDDLYRNGFVHSRVRAYRDKGLTVDVFRLRKDQALSYGEFEGVDVTTGSREALDRVLSDGHYKKVLVHFLDPEMWEVLRKHAHRIEVVVWVHGAEIQPWWRRQYNYKTEEELQLAKLQSDKRMAFWNELLRPMPANLRLVFVSRHFAEEVMEDLGFRLPDAQYGIIHNPINTALFSYQPKDRQQRCKILSIRPYASATYANDLSAKAIELLAERPFFKELKFHIIGDGPLFEEIVSPLQKYGNVVIERGFLTQRQIAGLHKNYGVFLCPTRMDTQGVSRDEAMSSGLVPVTNRVAAIPEFVDGSCGILAAGESAEEMAAGIEALYLQPDLFENMSREAADRVRRQTAAEIVVAQEIDEISRGSEAGKIPA